MEARERSSVLLVEDDADLAELQLNRLREAGYAVTHAATAERGLELALHQHFDLLVIDHVLPGAVRGLDLFRQVREAGRAVPAILATGLSDEGIVLEALRAGVTDFVFKRHDFLDHLVSAAGRALRERRNETQLAESQAQLAGIIDSAIDAVLTVGEERRISLFNPAAEQIFRCPAEQALGQPVERFLPAWEQLLSASRTSAPGRQTLRRETEAVRADGERFPLDVSLSRSDRLHFWSCIGRDATERKRAEEEHERLVQERAGRAEAERSEQRLRVYVNKLQEQAHLLDLAHALVRTPDDTIISWSQGSAQLYGWSADEAVGQNCHALLKTVFPAPLANIRAELEARGQWDGKLVHTRKDGSTVVVASHWALHRDAEGRPVAVLEVNNDVTELQQLQEALREADRRKDHFLATLAHELRNPLAPLRNALHTMMLAGENLDLIEESRRLMERQLKHLVRLIDDLLDLSRISRGKVQLRKERVPFEAVLEVAVETSRPHLEAAGHKLRLELPPEPVVVQADPTRLAQILANLLNNAAKYTPAQGEVCVCAAAEAERLVVRVRDNGIGIAPEMLPRVFEMFTQSERGLDRAQGGLGIGLSLVKGLVEMHGGSVEAFSEGPGRGSEFVVRLPLAATGSAADYRPAPPRRRTYRTVHRRRVLVVEDNPDGAASLATLLGMMGHQVRLAYDGPQALSEARTFRPEVILLDIGLPTMNGYEVARRLRQEPALADVLLVAMTGWGQEEDRRKSREAGCNAHLVKPVELSDLEPLLGADPSP